MARVVKEHRPLVGMAFVWAVLCLAFFWDILLAPADQIVAGNDLANMFQIWLQYAKTSILHGEFPLWNPYLFSGTPFAADPQPALFYPATWLALLMPVTRALGVILVVHVWWAAVGMSGWLRSEGASWWGALAGGAVFAFSGYVFARIQAGHIGVLTTGAWLPWGLWVVRKATGASNGSWRVVALGGAAVGLALLAGHTATFILVGLMWAIYAAWRMLQSAPMQRRRQLMHLFFALGLGLALAAVQWLPMVQMITGSGRVTGSSYDFASSYSWPVGYLLTLLAPNFFGEPVRTGYWGEGVYDELIFYAGILPLLLAWVAVKWQKKARFWVVMGLAALLLAFGSYGIVHRLFVRFVPLFATMRAPARAGLLFTLAVGVLAALGLTWLEQVDREQLKASLPLLSRPFIGWVLGATTILVIACYLVYAWGRESNSAAGRFWHLAGQLAFFGVVFALSGAWMHGWGRSGNGRWLPALGVGLILLDLWTLGGGLVRTTPAPESAYWRIVASHVPLDEGRVLPWGLNVFEQNGALQAGVRSVFGYNPLEDQAYNDLVSSVPDPRARAYDLLNTTHVISKSELELTADDTLSLEAKESGVYIYRRSTSMPRAWIALEAQVVASDQVIAQINSDSFDPAGVALVSPDTQANLADCRGTAAASSVQVVETGRNHYTLAAEGGGGVLVLSERYAPGWTATIDGDAAPVVPVDGVLQGVCLPAGSTRITLTYRPALTIVGASITGLGLLAFGLLLWRGRQRE